MEIRTIENIKVYLDTDVLISSLISSTGAAHFIVNELNIAKFISHYSVDEVKQVSNRLKLPYEDLEKTLESSFTFVDISMDLKAQLKKYKGYLLDPEDSHVLAGAVEGNVDFLLTYNLKDFKTDVIQKDFGTIALSPGDFMQFMRTNYEV